MFRPIALVSVLALPALLAGCGGKEGVTITQTVGAVGGSVAAGDGSGVQVPGGAVQQEVTISIEPVAEPTAPQGTVAVGPGYLFGPEGATFSVPVVITLAVDASKLPQGKTIDDVRIYTAPKGSTSYTELATSVVDGGKVSASTTHFSIFLPAVASTPVTPGCKATCAKDASGLALCTCTATCDGTAYTMVCYDGEGCACGGEDGRYLSVFPRCNDTAGLDSAWKSSGMAGCGYPGGVE